MRQNLALVVIVLPSPFDFLIVCSMAAAEEATQSGVLVKPCTRYQVSYATKSVRVARSSCHRAAFARLWWCGGVYVAFAYALRFGQCFKSPRGCSSLWQMLPASSICFRHLFRSRVGTGFSEQPSHVYPTAMSLYEYPVLY